MSDTKYNGWTNYATWRVNLEMFDGMDYQEYFINLTDTYALSECLKDYAQEILELSCDPNSLAVQYANAFISEVNWYEIAEHIVEVCKEEAA